MSPDDPRQRQGSGRLPGSEHRFLKGYLPLAVIVVALVAMVAIFPSRGEDVGGEASEITVGSTGLPQSGNLGGDDDDQGGGDEGPVQLCTDRDKQVADDPYSPPCFTYTGTDNGGETTRGVTADTIQISYRKAGDIHLFNLLAQLMNIELNENEDDYIQTFEGLIDYFNKHFEFYGRKLQLAPYDGKGLNAEELTGGGRENAANDALKVASEMGAFAEIWGTTQPYAEALARQKVINFGVPYMSREWFNARRPYSWSLLTDCSIVAEAASTYQLNRLFDQAAIYAGGNLKDQPRRLALIVPNNPEYQECKRAGLAVTDAQGKEMTLDTNYTLDLARIGSQATSIAAQVAQNDITTIACYCDPFMMLNLTERIDSAGLKPEWLVTGTAFVDLDFVAQGLSRTHDQWSRAFGVSQLPPQYAIGKGPGYKAYKEMRPNTEPSIAVDIFYYWLYQLAMGVQMAGPELTPESFEAGMFAYPQTTGPAGTWHYSPEHYTPTLDAKEVWWDPEAKSSFNGEKGAYQTDGKRYLNDQIPSGQPEAFNK